MLRRVEGKATTNISRNSSVLCEIEGCRVRLNFTPEPQCDKLEKIKSLLMSSRLDKMCEK